MDVSNPLWDCSSIIFSPGQHLKMHYSLCFPCMEYWRINLSIKESPSSHKFVPTPVCLDQSTYADNSLKPSKVWTMCWYEIHWSHQMWPRRCRAQDVGASGMISRPDATGCYCRWPQLRGRKRRSIACGRTINLDSSLPPLHHLIGETSSVNQLPHHAAEWWTTAKILFYHWEHLQGHWTC